MKTFMPFNGDAPHGAYEADFRRGYHHGAIAMIDALKQGVPATELESFVNAELRAWREDHAVSAFPPESDKSNRV